MVNGWLIGACELAAAPATGSQSGLGFVVTGNFVDFFRRHMPGDVAHLLADIITACAGGESPQFRLDIDGRLAAEPRTARLFVDIPTAWTQPPHVAPPP